MLKWSWDLYVLINRSLPSRLRFIPDLNYFERAGVYLSSDLKQFTKVESISWAYRKLIVHGYIPTFSVKGRYFTCLTNKERRDISLVSQFIMNLLGNEY